MNYLKLFTASLLIVIFACSKDNTTQEIPLSKSYTGVLVGSSGYYGLNFSRNNSNATIVFDGVTYNLSSTETLQNGVPLTLTDGAVSLTILLDANGQNPQINFDIPGHTVSATIADATALTENYVGQGTVTKDGVLTNKVTFNVTLAADNTFQAINKVILNGGVDEGKVDTINGTYVKNNNIIVFTYLENGKEATIALNIFENQLIGSQTDPETGTTVLELTKV